MTSYFETRFRYSEIKNRVWKELSEYLQKNIPIKEEHKVLDVGAGYCYFINNIKCKEKHAIDISKIPLLKANRDVITKIGDVRNLKKYYKENYFDIAFCSNILEHLEMRDVIKVLKQINFILKPNGKLIILSPNYKYSYREYFDDYDHKSILTDKNIKDILSLCKFKVEKIYPKFLPFSANELKFFNKFLFRAYIYSPIKPFAKQMLVVATKLN